MNLNAPQALVELMVKEGYSFLQTGRLIAPDGRQVPFELGLSVRVEYFTCTAGDGTFGIVVPANGTAEAEITWHLTHLFFDSFAEDSSFRAEALAAMAPADRPLRTEDLAAQPLGKLRGMDGEPLRDARGNPVLYIPPRSLASRPSRTSCCTPASVTSMVSPDIARRS
jgi:hypothetical protein